MAEPIPMEKRTCVWQSCPGIVKGYLHLLAEVHPCLWWQMQSAKKVHLGLGHDHRWRGGREINLPVVHTAGLLTTSY